MIDLFQNLIVPAAVAAIAAFATVTTGAFGYWNRNREHDIEMVRIALSILSGENKDTSLPGRKFGLRTLQKNTGVDIPADEFADWAQRGTLSLDPEQLSPNARIISSNEARRILGRLQKGFDQGISNRDGAGSLHPAAKSV